MTEFLLVMALGCVPLSGSAMGEHFRCGGAKYEHFTTRAAALAFVQKSLPENVERIELWEIRARELLTTETLVHSAPWPADPRWKAPEETR